MIESNLIKTLIVVNDQEQLVGTLTDGDIRRSLINNIKIDSDVRLVMCNTPHYFRIDEELTSSDTKTLEKNSNIMHFPVVNKNHEVIGLKIIQKETKKDVLNNPVFLMAGGFGTRLQPLTNI